MCISVIIVFRVGIKWSRQVVCRMGKSSVCVKYCQLGLFRLNETNFDFVIVAFCGCSLGGELSEKFFSVFS